jgi:hypothetical protein
MGMAQRNIYRRYDVVSGLRFISATQCRLPILGSCQTELPIGERAAIAPICSIHPRATTATRVGVALSRVALGENYERKAV